MKHLHSTIFNVLFCCDYMKQIYSDVMIIIPDTSPDTHIRCVKDRPKSVQTQKYIWVGIPYIFLYITYIYIGTYSIIIMCKHIKQILFLQVVTLLKAFQNTTLPLHINKIFSLLIILNLITAASPAQCFLQQDNMKFDYWSSQNIKLQREKTKNKNLIHFIMPLGLYVQYMYIIQDGPIMYGTKLGIIRHIIYYAFSCCLVYLQSLYFVL